MIYEEDGADLVEAIASGDIMLPTLPPGVKFTMTSTMIHLLNLKAMYKGTASDDENPYLMNSLTICSLMRRPFAESMQLIEEVSKNNTAWYGRETQVQLPEGVTPFMHINQNEFLCRKHKKLTEEDIDICECKYDASDPNSACVGRCLNLLTNIECTPGYCPCGENCRNQRFQKCEYAKTKLFRTEGRGWGLSADENIKAGQFIMEYCGEVLSSEAAKKMCLAYEAHKIKDAYIMSLNANYFIDATKKGSLARFINHSCQPNCETRKWIVLGETRVGIFAKRDISIGMELSYNYNFEWYGGAPVHCLCGAANCSLFLGAKSQGYRECSNVLEEGDNRHIVENLPLYDDESSPVISGTSGENEHTKILNDGEGSTFQLEPTNSATKKKSQHKPKLKLLKNC
ncbi:histone-lysine N-methyltransferase ASHH1-like [Solanum pennellii]|uniref:Histone-lysine N-methyltransferase ASHH1-like n=1 Tax=Solanum pennellii TaxID=28526 RepID=A0ABM1HL58_SOLPN|nr:histone-lysine N-methyltransferase ASHH1-like [Solanum pennellii]